MEILLFSALAVLIVGAVWVGDRRMSRIEARLEALDGIEELGRRVGALAAELDRKEASSRVQAKLTEVAETERRLVAAMGDLTRQVTELRRSAERQGRERAPPPTPELGDRVREHLADQGFEGIQVLSDPDALTDGSGRVVFEAHRRQVMHKGHVRIVDGAIVDSQARAAYTAFP